MYANRFDADDRQHWLATLVIMFLLIVVSGLIGQRFLASFDAIVVCYAASKYIIAMMYFVSKRRHEESVELATAVGWVIVFFVFIGLSILASLIRHAILDDMALSDFRALSAVGGVCFFLGKQYAYFMERPELRTQLVVNTLAVFVLSGFALLLPRTGYILLGLTAAVICYAFLSLKYLSVAAERHDHPRNSAITRHQP